MAEQTFRSPNFFDRELDLSGQSVAGPTGVPAGVIGTSLKGPAFVPITVRDFNQFTTTFGNLDPNSPSTYAVKQYLDNKTSLTFLKVLGAGANSNATDVLKTQTYGRVLNAGFSVNTGSNDSGGVVFLMSKDAVQSEATFGMPMFDDNDSFSGITVNTNEGPQSGGQLIKGAVFLPTGSRMMIFGDVSLTNSDFVGTARQDGGAGLDISTGNFKIAISSSLSSGYSYDDGIPGVRIYTASLNPTSDNYVGKILNSDPNKFVSEQHYLYAHFPVDNEVATPVSASILSGTSGLALDGKSFRDLFGTMDTRYTAPKTTNYISQPYGSLEHDLFYFESLDDGSYANNLYKISITNIKVSTDETNPFGSFTVQIRDFADNDINPNVIEQFNECNLDPGSPNYIANVIGDRKIRFSFDTTNPSEKRLLMTGQYDNKSKFVRVIVSQAVQNRKVPKTCLPFGFRGPSLLKTTDLLVASGSGGRLGNSYYANGASAIIPPIPYRTKVTYGLVADSGNLGDAGPTELVAPSLYWGVKFERNNNVTDPNPSTEKNELLSNLTKFMGIEKMDSLVTGSTGDLINNNKFTLAKVALMNGSINDVTGSASAHMLRAAYIRNGDINPNDYTINNGDSFGGRVTLASLVNAIDQSYDQSQYAVSAASNFNKFSSFAKFTNFMYGGFDGVNILDKNAKLLNDKSVSFESVGGAADGYVPAGFAENQNGSQKLNNGVASYRTAIEIMTDPFVSTTNVLAIPGIREPYVTDYAGSKCRDYSLSMYVMDIPCYDDNGNVIFDDSTAKPNVEKTATFFESRAIDNSYVATYFPDIFVDDPTNRRKVKVPASVAALSALAFNDKVSYPWFAPAGFNRAALDFVTNVSVRLNVGDRDRLYDARINPIATFPRQGYVIYGQKTLQISKSALDRVNVRRLLLEVKRIIVNIAQGIVFEQNTPVVRNKFVADSALQLGFIQAQAGIEAFQVIMNESNNTQDDIANNRLRGRIVVVPTRVIEYIAIDFIVTNSGVQFV